MKIINSARKILTGHESLLMAWLWYCFLFVIYWFLTPLVMRQCINLLQPFDMTKLKIFCYIVLAFDTSLVCVIAMVVLRCAKNTQSKIFSKMSKIVIVLFSLFVIGNTYAGLEKTMIFAKAIDSGLVH